MYLLDAIVSEDEQTYVNIMHDANNNTFALVVEERPGPEWVTDAASATHYVAPNCWADLAVMACGNVFRVRGGTLARGRGGG